MAHPICKDASADSHRYTVNNVQQIIEDISVYGIWCIRAVDYKGCLFALNAICSGQVPLRLKPRWLARAHGNVHILGRAAWFRRPARRHRLLLVLV